VEVNAALATSYIVSGLMIVSGVFVAARWLQRRGVSGYWVFFIGALTFASSQLVHVPLLWLISLTNPWFVELDPALSSVLAAITLGLAAGVCEEWARYGVFRWALTKQRSFDDSLMHGVGHGGIEAVYVALMVFAQLLAAWAITRAGADQMTSIPEQREAIHQGMAAFWATPWHLPLLGTVERLIVVPFHIACSVLVALGVRRRQLRWVWWAVLAHTVLDFFAVYASSLHAAIVELILLAVTLVLIVLVACIPRLRAPEEATA